MGLSEIAVYPESSHFNRGKNMKTMINQDSFGQHMFKQIHPNPYRPRQTLVFIVRMCSHTLVTRGKWDLYGFVDSVHWNFQVLP